MDQECRDQRIDLQKLYKGILSLIRTVVKRESEWRSRAVAATKPFFVVSDFANFASVLRSQLPFPSLTSLSALPHFLFSFLYIFFVYI